MQPDAQDPEAQDAPDTWITKIQTYLKDNILHDQHVFMWIVHVAMQYTLVEGDLNWCGANGIIMQCITREEGYELLTELH
jgi:hypothetical protein